MRSGGAAAAEKAEGRGREQYGSPRERHAAWGPVALQCQESGPFLTSRQTTPLCSSQKLLQAEKERRISVYLLACLV